ncbi:MAG: isoleucine--tRNA ligase [Parvibaculaceae bacterium]
MSADQTPDTENQSETRDYRETLRLPKTDFPMKAGLPKREPEMLERWAELGLYERLRKESAGREKFVFHNGPPYANGAIHMGHALNHILKDIVVRSQQMMGKDALFVPGWDCHGLPIEWKIEEKYRAKGKDKDTVPVLEFRKECREFADEWVGVQRDGFKRLGIQADWENPYLTMSYDAEAVTVAEFQKFIMNGGLYRGSKPVMWSVVEKTALAEAEVEYHDHVSPTIWVRFPVVSGARELEGASVVIWTTTPWTIPGNRAIAFSDRFAYGLYKVEETAEESWAEPGEVLVLADGLADQVKIDARIEAWRRVGNAPDLAGTVCAHPFRGQGYDFDVNLYPGDFVTDETGTGFVHIAPGHGQDDYLLGQKHGVEVPYTVDEAGVYYDDVPLFAGKRVLKPNGKEGDANNAVIEALKDAGKLLTRGKLEHSYPHSWRSKAPLIFRNTPQWFVSMEKNDLRKTALSEIDKVRFVPESGRNRIRSMVDGRPDWVLSRQRAWGVPLTVFVHKETGDILRDEKVNERIVEAVRARGADAWFEDDPQTYLGNDYAADDYEQVMDILDVWFDSGCTHAFVLEARDDHRSPADLYLEGSDQHRGWFQSSLLESCGTRGRAPYKQVVTHGFLLDEHGHKMAKSGKNAVAPDKICQQNGAEILRLWVGSSDFTEDMRVGPEIIKSCVDSYRKLRNTFRFLLGNLDGFDPAGRVAPADMPELERYMLHKLADMDALVRQSYLDYDFKRVFHTLSNFMTVDLSAFYFDVRKDTLYCDPLSSKTRRACQTVMDEVFMCLTAWLAPIMSFTAEEVWLSRFPSDDGSVHLRTFPDVPEDWRDDALAAKWAKVRQIRRVVTGALEVERREKRIGSSLEAAPTVYVSDPAFTAAMENVDLAEIAITSQATLSEGKAPEGAFTLDDIAGIAVVPGLAEGRKCARSWKISPDVGSVPGYPDLSPRDAAAVAEFDGAA